MKKLLYILLSVALLASCEGKFEENLFDETSSKRVQALIDDARKTLLSSEKGWYFSYFPGKNNTFKKGGYWMWMKFTEDERGAFMVEMMAEDVKSGGAYASETSGCDIVRGRGAMLTFNIHNNILGFWTEPSSQTPFGKEGDSSFTIAEVTTDEIRVLGLRTNTMMHFYRVKDEQTVAEAFDGIKDDSYFYPYYSVSIPGARKGTAELNRRLMKVEYTDASGELKTAEISSVPKLDGTGILLADPLKFEGLDPIYSFTFDAENLRLTSDENNGAVVITMPAMNDLINVAPATFTLPLTTETSSQSFIDKYTQVIGTKNITALGFVAGVNKANVTVAGKRSLRFTQGTTQIYYLVSFEPIGDTKDRVLIRYEEPGYNGATDANIQLEGLVKLMDKDAPVLEEGAEVTPEFTAAQKAHPGTPYTLTCDDEKNPKWIKFVCQTDESLYFTVNF